MATDNIDIANSQFEKQVDRREKLKGNNGTGGNPIEEPVPYFNKTPIEKVISNKNGWLVLGGDRLASPFSGYAGAGFTQSSAIDMVVGRKSGTEDGVPDKDKIVDSDTFNDAARIYITQKGNVDTYFGIADGKYADDQSNTATKSAVVAKADHVRVFGREGVKIVTGKSKNRGGQKERNSNGGDYDRNGTIELIAGNYTEKGLFSRREILQPVIKGDNLVELLNELIEEVNGINSRCITNSSILGGIASLLGALGAPVLTAPCALISSTMFSNNISGVVTTINLGGMQTSFLKPTGGTYINSTHVFAT